MNLNDIFENSTTINEVNYSILKYLLESTQSNKGAIYICDNYYNVIEILATHNIDEVEIFNNTLVNTNSIIYKYHDITQNKKIVIIFNNSNIHESDIKILSSYITKLYLSPINIQYYSAILKHIDELFIFIKSSVSIDDQIIYKILTIDEKLLKMLCYNEHEIINMNINTIIHKDDISYVLNNVNTSNKIIIRFQTKTNKTIYMISKIINTSNNLYIIMSNDINKYITIEKLKHDSVNILCSYVMSQLNGIVGFCDLIMIDSDNNEIKNNLNIVIQTAKDTISTMNNTLKSHETNANLDYIIDDIISESIDFVTNLIISKKITLLYHKKNSEIKCIMDRNKMTQLFINIFYLLIENSDPTHNNISIHLHAKDNNLLIAFNSNIIITNTENIVLLKQNFTDSNATININETLIEITIPISLTGENLSKLNDMSEEILKISYIDEIKVLYIEDNICNIKLVKKIMNKFFPYVNVYSACQGYIGIDLLTENKFSLILLDIRLPDMSGIDIIDIIRNSEKNKNTPIIIISCELTVENIEYCKSKGIVDVIHKPIQIQQFKDTINSYIH